MLRRRQQVGVVPRRIALIGTDRHGGAAPQLGGGLDLRGVELNAHDLGEGLLRGAAGGAAVRPRLRHRRRRRDALTQCLGDHVLHPTFDERQQRLEAGGGTCVAGGDPRRQVHALQLAHRVLDCLWVARFQVELAGSFLDVGGINDQAHGVFLNGGHEALHQPRNVLEQALAGGLPGTDVDQYFLGGDVEVAGDGLNVVRQEGGGASGGDRQAEVRTGQCLRRQVTQSVSQLHAEVHSGHGIHHGRQRAHHLAGFLWEGVQLRVVHVLGHGGDHALPHWQRGIQPLARVPRGHGARSSGQRGGVIQPQLR